MIADNKANNNFSGENLDLDFDIDFEDDYFSDVVQLNFLNKLNPPTHDPSDFDSKLEMFQAIFIDHLQEIYAIPTVRPVVIENIERMLKCGNPAYGGVMYACPKCERLKFVPFHCKSKLCPSCGNLYTMQRAEAIQERITDSSHRHIVFTIDEDLRIWFRRDRTALNLLFQSVATVLNSYFAKQKPVEENWKPGFVMVLHTFGNDLKWNPHIHVLLTFGALGKSGMWKNFNYISYQYLRTAWRTVLLKNMKKHFDDTEYAKEFKSLVGQIYKKDTSPDCDTGFYVHAPKTRCDVQNAVKYIGRYLGRPAISMKRIDSYDGTNVTWHYKSHLDDKTYSVTSSAIDFIKLLIVHIPDKNFKMVRYGGLYSSEVKNLGYVKAAQLLHAISEENRPHMRQSVHWQFAMMLAFGINPKECPCCHVKMDKIFIKYRGHSHTFPAFGRHNISWPVAMAAAG